MISLLLIFFLGISAKASSLWTAVDHHEAQLPLHRLQDGYASTLYGASQIARQSHFGGFATGEKSPFLVETEGFRRKVRFSVYFPDQANVLTNPVMIILPPGTSGGTDPTALRIVEFFRDLGYICVVLASASSYEYASYYPTDILSKDLYSNYVQSAILATKSTFGLQGRVHLYTESMGGFFGSYFWAKDSLRAQPLINGTSTFTSPPLELNTWLQNIDGGVLRECDHPHAAAPMTLANLLKLAAWTMGSSSTGNESTRDLKCLTVRSFQTTAMAVTRRIVENLGYGKNTVPTLAEPDLTAWWQSHSTYQELLRHLINSPSDHPYVRGSDYHIESWVTPDLVDRQICRPIRFIIAKDDFLATSQVINHYGDRFGKEHFLVLGSGGHLGFNMMSEYKGLLTRAFQRSLRSSSHCP